MFEDGESFMKIMVVEDEIIAALGLLDQLEDWGYEVSEPVMTGEEAVRRAEAERPDLILMDINLHGKINGIDVAERIGGLAIPVIFVTGYLDEKMSQRALGMKPLGLLKKPLDYGTLRSLIESARH